jgi:hypothetical protein
MFEGRLKDAYKDSEKWMTYTAAKLCKMCKTTRFKPVKGLRAVKSHTHWVEQLLSPSEQRKIIADTIKLVEKWDFTLSKKEVLKIVGQYLKETSTNIFQRNNSW